MHTQTHTDTENRQLTHNSQTIIILFKSICHAVVQLFGVLFYFFLFPLQETKFWFGVQKHLQSSQSMKEAE